MNILQIVGDKRKLLVVLAAVLLVAGTAVFLSTRSAGPSEPSTGLTAAVSKVQDPKGDLGSKPSYLDIVSGQVSLTRSSEITFQVSVADQIPKQPKSFLAYVWVLTSDISGFNRPGIYLAYDNKTDSWDAVILNNTGTQRPIVVLKGLTFALNGNSASVVVPLSLLHDPRQFTWHVLSRDSPAGAGNPRVDKVPDDKDAQWQNV